MISVSWKPLALGSLLGVAAAVSPGGVFVFLLVAGTCAALHRFASKEDRAFLIRLFVFAFAVRALLSLALDLGSWIAEGYPPMQKGPAEYWDLGILEKTREYIRIGDSDAYSQRGYCLAQYVGGSREAVVLRRIQVYGYHAYILVIGWFYSLFGFSPVSVKWLNGWFGALHVLAVFFLAKRCFQSGIARWAGVGVALFPTLALWSATNLKEPLFFLLTALLFLLFTALRAPAGLKRWALTGGAFLLVFWMLQGLGRKEVSLSLAVCLMAVFFLEKCLRRRGGTLVLLLGMILLLQFKPWDKVRQAIHLGLYRHMGYVHTESTTYRYLPDRFYNASSPLLKGTLTDADARAVIRSLPIAAMHYLLQPFPWWPMKRFAGPIIAQMIGWYFLLLFAAIGVAAGLRWNAWNCGFLAAAGSVWVLMGALSGGNIGTLIRLRDMVTPIVLIFAAAGLWALVRGREGLSREGFQP